MLAILRCAVGRSTLIDCVSSARQFTNSTRERHMGKGNNSQKNDKKNMKTKEDGKKQGIKSAAKKA
jgi:hypothetical protein